VASTPRDDISPLPKVKGDWVEFEASLLTKGFFQLFPLENIKEFSPNHRGFIRLWRACLDRALFDALRGPMVDLAEASRNAPLQETRRNESMRKRAKDSERAYRNVIHWLYSDKSIYQPRGKTLKRPEDNAVEEDSDFTSVCALANLEPGLVKSAFIKLMTLKEKQSSHGH